MAVTAWKFPGTVSEVARPGSDGGSWSSPGNIQADDGADASYDIAFGEYADWLVAAGFGFTTSDIPNGSIIDGIEVEFEWQGQTSNHPSEGAIHVDTQSSTDPPGSADRGGGGTSLGDTEVTKQFGGASDLWGLSWSDADVRSSGLSVWWSPKSNAGAGDRTAWVDYVRVRVYYTPGITSSDTVRPKVSEISALLVGKPRSDTVAPKVSESSTIAQIKFRADTLNPKVAESSTITDLFAEFVASSRPRCMAVEATVHDGTALVVRYLSNRPYITLDSDTPARMPFAPVLRGDSDIDRQLGSVLGLRAQLRGGDLRIVNPGRQRDAWLEDAWQGHPLKIKLGDPDWPYAWFVTIFDGVSGRVRGDDMEIAVALQGKDARLREPVQTVIEAHGEAIGSNRSLCYGYPKNVQPKKINTDPSDNYYRIHEIGGIEDPAVTRYVNQGPSTSPSINKEPDWDNVHFWLSGAPGGILTCDPKGIKDSGGTWIETPGASLEHLSTRTHPHTPGVARGGSATTIQFALTESDVDDFYNGDTVRKSDANVDLGNERTILDYDGATRTATVSDWTSGGGVAAQKGDGYEILGRSMQAGVFLPAELVSSAFSAYDTALGDPRVGLWIADDSSGVQVFERVLGPAGYWGMTRQSQLTIGLLVDPSGETADLTLNEHDLYGALTIEKWLPPVHRLHVGFGRNHTVARGGVAKDGLSGAREQWVTEEYEFVQVAEDRAIKEKWPEARELTVKTVYTERADAEAERDRLWPLVSVQRKLYTASAFAKPMQEDLGAIIEMTHPDYYDLAGGKNLFLYGMRELPAAGKTELRLWG